MRICFVANAASVHTRRWIMPLVDKGYHIDVVSYVPVTNEISGVDVIDLTKLTNVPKARFLYWAWWLRHHLKKRRPDVLHAHQIQAAGWLGAMSGFHPFVVSAWGSDILVEPYKSRSRRWLVQQVLRASDRLIVPSEVMARMADQLNYSRGRLQLIPWGIEIDTFRATPADRLVTRRRLGFGADAQLVFCPRALSPLYNQDIVVEAVHGLASRFPKISVLLLRYNVDRRYAAHVERLVAALHLERHVRWLPPQVPEKMAQLYRAADAAISIPSSEGYGFSVYEAMATGCPTVISDLPLFGNELVDGVQTLKTPVRDVITTREKLGALLGSEQLRQNLRQCAFDVCRHHSVSRRIEEAEILYRRLSRNDGS